MRWLLPILLLVSSVASGKGAQIDVRTEGELPFRRADLIQLLRTRLQRGQSARAVVRRGAGDRVVITVGDRSREADITRELDELDGARLVALLLLDLVEQDGPPVPPSHAVVHARPAHGPGQAEAPRFIFSVAPRVSFRMPVDALALEPMIDLQLRIHRWLWSWLEVGYSWSSHSDRYDHAFHTVPIRTGVGVQYRWFELRGGLALRPYWLGRARTMSEEIAYDVDGHGVQVGGTAALRLSIPFGRWIVVHATAGVDLFGRREIFAIWRQYCVDAFVCSDETVEVLQTSHVVPWVGLGVGFAVGG